MDNLHIYREFYPFCNEWIYGDGERGEFFRDRAVVYASVCPNTYGILVHMHTGYTCTHVYIDSQYLALHLLLGKVLTKVLLICF